MKTVRFVEASSNPFLREQNLLRKLEGADLPGQDRLRLSVDGRFLFLDGFADSLDAKLETERACRRLASDCIVINRLRVAAPESSPVF